MLARRRKGEFEELKQQQAGTLKKEDIYKDRPFLKELMFDVVQKRRKIDQQQQVNPNQMMKYTALAYDPVKTVKDELDKNTPMWYSLQYQKGCQTTVRIQHSTMFWLGYFIRRIMHEDNLDKLKQYNHDQLQKWESDNEVKHYFLNQAKKIRVEAQTYSTEQQMMAYTASKEREEQENLQKEIQHFLSRA